MDNRFWDVKIYWKSEQFGGSLMEAGMHVGYEYARTVYEAIEICHRERDCPDDRQWTEIEVILRCPSLP